MKNSKKGSATPFLVIILLLMIVIMGLFIKLNWDRFTAEVGFALTVVGIIAGLVLLIVLVIWLKIRKTRREHERIRAERERAKAAAMEKEQGKSTGLSE